MVGERGPGRQGPSGGDPGGQIKRMEFRGGEDRREVWRSMEIVQLENFRERDSTEVVSETWWTVYTRFEDWTVSPGS